MKRFVIKPFYANKPIPYNKKKAVDINGPSGVFIIFHLVLPINFLLPRPFLHFYEGLGVITVLLGGGKGRALVGLDLKKGVYLALCLE